MPHRVGPVRAWRAILALVLLAVPVAGRAADRYVIDQTFGDISFTVRSLGIFSSHGGFRRWDGTLTIDPDHPDRSQVDVDIHADSVFLPWRDGTTLLRSPAYFDVVTHPEIHFSSSSVTEVATQRYQIHGLLRLRGVTEPQDFDAVLIDSRIDPTLKTEIADFLVTGKLRRSVFGMTADALLISDSVSIAIRVRLRLGEALRAN